MKNLIWIAAGVIFLAVGYALWKGKRTLDQETRDLSFRSVTSKITLSARDGWRELGFVLRPGDTVMIATDGNYANSRGGEMSGEGIDEGIDEASNTWSYDPLFPHGCLIARTTGTPTEVFHVGSRGLLRSSGGGRLEVRINDLQTGGNYGELKVEATTFQGEAPEGYKLRDKRDSKTTPMRR